ncbi:hypothetical protein OPQ81_006152 [Rhizoctonia solani]|nr:hypothetical protein OPQ81_006152 [Rhizoctonia solani]
MVTVLVSAQCLYTSAFYCSFRVLFPHCWLVPSWCHPKTLEVSYIQPELQGRGPGDLDKPNIANIIPNSNSWLRMTDLES